MTVIGPRTAVDLALPVGVDGSRVLAFQMRNGKTAQQIIAEAATVIGVVNERVAARYGGISYITQRPFTMMAQGEGSRMTPISVEGRDPDPVRSDTIGHMLPLRDYKDANAWTPEYLRDAMQEQITADIQVIADSWENRVDDDFLRRIFSNAENQIGTGGYDVPWAIGTGTNVNYIPPQNTGFAAFDSTHTHFKFQNATWNAAGANTFLELLVADLRHHAINGRIVIFVSGADTAIYNAITGGKFAKAVPSGIEYVAGSGGPAAVVRQETTGAPGEVFGVFLSDTGIIAELRAWEKIPTKYAFATKSYGVNNMKNGVALREHPDEGFGLRPDPQVTRSILPKLEKILFKGVHGIGINNRLNGVVGYAGGTSYAAPTW